MVKFDVKEVGVGVLLTLESGAVPRSKEIIMIKGKPYIVDNVIYTFDLDSDWDIVGQEYRDFDNITVNVSKLGW